MSQVSILLVDDEHDFRHVLSKRLSRKGFVLCEAESGRHALECMEKFSYDVVVLDVKMPEMNGLDTLAVLRSKFLETEVILLTGHASTEDGIAGIKAGAFDYLTKPVELEHLTEKIYQAYEKIIRRREKIQEQKFRERMERRIVAAERLAALGTLASGIAHEVNNPLAVINDAAGWLLGLVQDSPKDMPLQKELLKGLGKIESSAQRAGRITHQLLGHARQSDFEIKQIDLCAVVREALELVEKQAKAKNITFEVKDVQAMLIRSDPGQLRQVFINLLSNAVHSAQHNGKVQVDFELLEDAACVRVMDDGSGISELAIDHIFEPFFSTKPEGQGTGLGLYVSRDIMHKLGGSLVACNQSTQGAQFTLTLPLDFQFTAKKEVDNV